MSNCTLLSPRPGLSGMWDRLAGPGAGTAENVINLVWSWGFTAFVAAYSVKTGLAWTPLQWAIVLIFALDIAGGVTMNASPAARRWWHRSGQDAKAHLVFAAVHLHPIILHLVFPGTGWRPALEMYGYLLVASAALLFSPHQLRRPIAHGLFAIALTLCLLRWPLLSGLAWFGPLFFLKLLLAHPLDDGAEVDHASA